MKTAFVLISQGQKYHKYINPLLESMKNNLRFPYDVFLWSDLTQRPAGVKSLLFCTYSGFPATTLHRYHMFLQAETDLRAYDQVFYTDIDMRWVSLVRLEDIASEGITATLHPGFVVDRSHIVEWTGKPLPSQTGTPDRNPESTAYIPPEAENQYFCGGFNGGSAKAFLDMAHVLRQNIDIDARNGVKALWNDESHLNNYLWKNPPSHILSPSFCYPEGYRGQWMWNPNSYKPVLLALDKSKR